MKAVGEINGRAKLTWQIVSNCRERYERLKQERHNDNRNYGHCCVTIEELANEENVSISTMSDIIHYRTWKPNNFRPPHRSLGDLGERSVPARVATTERAGSFMNEVSM